MNKLNIKELGGTGGMMITFREPKFYTYSPKNDITTYELALLTPAFAQVGVFGFAEFIDNLPTEAKRHFEEIKS